MDNELTEREMRLVDNCMRYADADPAGLPGHNLMIIIAKLARQNYQLNVRNSKLESVARHAYAVDQGIAEFYPDDPEAVSESLGHLEQALLLAGFQFPGD